MKNIKRSVILLLCLAMVLSMLPASMAEGVSYKKEIIIGNPQDITTTDPQGSNTDPNMILFYLTHETLVDLDGATVVPGMAEFEAIDDCTYRFTIPSDVTFTDGTPCTANDIKYTFTRAMESSFTSTKVARIANMEVVSDTEIIITLSEPDQDFLTTLAHRSLSILSEKAVTEQGADASAMGTGMYKLEKWVPGDYVSVVRYDGYRGEKAKTERIVLRFMSENSARVIALQTGEIDICLDIPDIETSQIENDSKLSLIRLPDVRMMYLAFNTSKAPFDNKLVRQAIAHAVDKEMIVYGAYDGNGTVHNSNINRGQFGLNENLEPYAFDLDTAKAMLAEAGYPNGLDIEISTYKGGNRLLILQILQADMAEIGINVKINELETAALKSLMKEGGHEIALYAWTDADGTDFTVRGMLYSTSGSNRTKLADPTLDAMIDAALVEPDIAAREQKYFEIQDYVKELCPVVPLCTGVINIGTKAGVEGVIWKSTNKHDYRMVCMPEA